MPHLCLDVGHVENLETKPVLLGWRFFPSTDDGQNFEKSRRDIIAIYVRESNLDRDV